MENHKLAFATRKFPQNNERDFQSVSLKTNSLNKM